MRIGASVGPEIDRISELSEEFDFVEIAIGEMEIDPDEIEREELQKQLEEKHFDLVVHLPFRQPLVTGVEELDKANREYIERLISFSRDLGAEKVVVHVNNRYGVEQKEKHEEKLVEIMSKLDEFGKRRDLEVTFENVPEKGNPAVSLQQLGEIAENEKLSLCLDLGHAYAQDGQEELEEFLDEHLGAVSHLHVQDSIKGEDSHVAVGHGKIDWEAVGKKLYDFEGTATIEVFTEDLEYQRISMKKFLEEVQ